MTAYIDRIRKSGQDYTLRDVEALHDGDMMSRYAGRKVSIIGDSISTYNAAGYKIDGYNMYYPSGTVTDPALTWWMRVIHASGAALEVNASWAGSMATNRHSNPNYPDFYQRCGLLGSPELIFVQLGTNDYNQSAPLGEYDFETAYAELSEANFRTAYIKGVKALQANYPGAEIVLMVLYMGDGYAESIRHIGAVMGLTVIDVRGYVREQGSHPGAYGMRQISSAALNPMDAALELPGESADAAAVGSALAGKVNVAQGSAQAGKALVVGDDGNVTTGDAGIPEAVKTALLEIFKHVAYVDASGQTWYEALEEALGVDTDFYNIHHWSLSEGLLSKLVGGANTNQSDTSMYPSRVNITDQTNRRSIGVSKGKAPYYRYGVTALSSGLYPIPVPASANHVRIAITPINQYVYCHFIQYDASTNQYSDSILENRIQWTQITNEGLEKDITNPGNMFMVINMKYDNAGSTYPVEPQDITVEFSEVN